MTREEKIEKLRNLRKAYILYSLYTRIPFVECEQTSFYDQTYVFETKEDAEEAAKTIFDGGDPVGITELNTVEMAPPSENSNVVPFKKMLRNQIREHLTKFPLFGINAVFFKPAGERGESLPLDDVLPNEVKDAVNKEMNDLTGVHLTGIYFAQYMRRPNKDLAVAKERYEEFFANLARAKLFLPVIPEDGHRDDASLDLSKCMLPVYTPQQEGDASQSAEGSEPAQPPKVSALGLFTNMDEVAVHSRNHLSEVRVVRVALDEVRNFVPEAVNYIVINPLTFAITLKIDDVIRVIKEIKDKED